MFKSKFRLLLWDKDWKKPFSNHFYLIIGLFIISSFFTDIPFSSFKIIFSPFCKLCWNFWDKNIFLFKLSLPKGVSKLYCTENKYWRILKKSRINQNFVNHWMFLSTLKIILYSPLFLPFNKWQIDSGFTNFDSTSSVQSFFLSLSKKKSSVNSIFMTLSVFAWFSSSQFVS